MSVAYDITAEALGQGGFRALHAGDDYDHDFTLQRNSVAFDLSGESVAHDQGRFG